MIDRRSAELVLESAVGGGSPVDGDMLLFTTEGWKFRLLSEAAVVPHTHTTADITSGTFAKSFLPSSVAYEDEANTFSGGDQKVLDNELIIQKSGDAGRAFLRWNQGTAWYQAGFRASPYTWVLEFQNNASPTDDTGWTSLISVTTGGLVTVANHFHASVVGVTATNALYLDYNTHQHTYIAESADNQIDIVTNGAFNARFAGGHMALPATGRYYLDGGFDTYIRETSANLINIVAGGVSAITIQYNGSHVITDIHGKLTAISRFTSYTADGVWNANALPSFIYTVNNNDNRLIFGYHDGGAGHYVPSLGFSTVVSDGATNGLNIIQTRVVGTDSANRFSVTFNGQIQWGSGSAVADVNLYRDAANRLRTDDALVIGGSFGLPATSVLYLDWTTHQHTYLQENSDDNVIMVVGGVTAITFAEAASTVSTTVSGNLTVGSLGTFDASDVPTDREFLVYNSSVSRWRAETIQFTFGNSDIKNTINGDNTTFTYIFLDPGAGADSPAGAPPVPVLKVYGSHKSITVAILGNASGDPYSKPADFRRFVLETSTNNFSSTANTVDTTSDKVVHSRLTPGTTYYFRAKVVDRAGNESSYSSVVSTTPVDSETAAFGVLLAGEIGVVSLSAINATIGDIVAGQIRNNANTAGFFVDTWAGASGPAGTWTRYFNLAATGSNPFIEHPMFRLTADGNLFAGSSINIGVSVGTTQARISTLNATVPGVTDQFTYRFAVNTVDGSALNNYWEFFTSDSLNGAFTDFDEWKLILDGAQLIHVRKDVLNTANFIRLENANVTIPLDLAVEGALSITGEPVSFGANDSGGSGFRQVLVPNA